MGRQHDERRLYSEPYYRPRGVVDPEHAWTLYAREPGDLGPTPERVLSLSGRSGKACGRKPDMHVAEGSDIGVVPMKGPNKSGQPEAEALEGRPVTKGNSEERRL